MPIFQSPSHRLRFGLKIPRQTLHRLLFTYCFPIVTLCSLALTAAVPVNQQEVHVTSFENNNTGLGDYNFSYELSDGTKRSEVGELKDAGTDRAAMSVRGSYSWTAPDGTVWEVAFIADENGFQLLENDVQAPSVGLGGSLVASLLG